MKNLIDEIKPYFNLARINNHPGLSTIIPFPNNQISKSEIIEAILDNMFIGLLSKKHSIKFNYHDESSIEFDENIANKINTILPSESAEKIETYKNRFNFISKALQTTDSDYIESKFDPRPVAPSRKWPDKWPDQPEDMFEENGDPIIFFNVRFFLVIIEHFIFLDDP